MSDLFQAEAAVQEKPRKRLSLPAQTGVDYPPAFHPSRNRLDPRLADLLHTLRRFAAGDDHDALLHCLCCGVYWLDLGRARLLAVEVERLLTGDERKAA